MDRNFRCHYAEIDIIARIKNTLVFCEVKYRKTNRFGYSEEAVDARKISRISQATMYYIYSKGIAQDMPIRFDVIAVNGSEIKHIEDAFDVNC